MPTPCVAHRNFLPPQLLLALLAWLSWPNVTQAVDYGNEVTVLIEPRQAVATSLMSGRRAIPLDAQETVIGSGASGINAIVVTSRRLLGFLAAPSRGARGIAISMKESSNDGCCPRSAW